MTTKILKIVLLLNILILSWTVSSAQSTQDSTKEIGVQKWRLWRIFHDIQELKEARKLIATYEDNLKKADSTIVIFDNVVKNQEATITKQDEKIEIISNEKALLEEEQKKVIKQYRTKIFKLIIIITIEGIVIILLL